MNDNNRPFYPSDERRIDFWEFLGFDSNDEPKCGLWWMLSLVPSVLAIGAALGGLLWLATQ